MTQFWKFLQTVAKAVTKAANYVLPQHIGYIAVGNNAALARRNKDIQLVQLKLQYLQHPENLDFNQYLAELDREQAQELQAFVQFTEDQRLQKQFDFGHWRLQQEKTLQRELIEQNQTLQRELATYQRQTSLRVIEEQKRIENFPVWLVASDLLNSHLEEGKLPLRVFFAPPRLQFERSASTTSAAIDFPEIELTLAEGLRQFFKDYSRADRPIDFLAGAWVSKSFHSEASIKALFGVLKSEPTLVLESEVDGDYLNFRIAYWGISWSKYRYEPVISRLPYRQILSESAKARAQKWLDTREKLIAAGENPQEVDSLYGGDNVKNLETLEREQRLLKSGIDARELKLEYIINKQDFEQLCQFLIICHCLFAGLVIDEYFLVQYSLPPLLPPLLADLIANVPDREIVKEITRAIVSYYQKIYQLLEKQRANLMPELMLDLAQSFANLSQKNWARQQIVGSVKSWLKLHNLSQSGELDSLLNALSAALTINDLEYVEKLNQCLAAIDYVTRLNVEEACYRRGMSNFQKQEYQAAILDFNQAMAINPTWVKVCYYRGLAYAHLQRYQEAIEDYTRALEIDQWAEAYNNRGNAHYKLEDYQNAITDYNRAIALNPNCDVVLRNRDLAKELLETRERRQQQEQEYLGWIENLGVVNTLLGHAHTVRCLAISPDGRILASGSYDNTIKLWELDTGKAIRTLVGHTRDIEAIAISPDGQILASGSDDNTIKLWQLATGEEIGTLIGHSSCLRSLVFSPNGKILASGSYDYTIKLWELDTGKESQTLTEHSGLVRCLAFSPDGKILASGSADQTIKLWQINRGKSVFPIDNLEGHSETINSIVFNPNGQTLFSASDDKTIRQWQVKTGAEMSVFQGHSNNVYALAISKNGQTLVSGSADGKVKIWRLDQGQVVRTLEEESRLVYAVLLFSPRQMIVSGGSDHRIKIWR